jgi:hypothetical protein
MCGSNLYMSSKKFWSPHIVYHVILTNIESFLQLKTILIFQDWLALTRVLEKTYFMEKTI